MKKLGFGLMRLPYSEDKTWGNIDLEKTREMIDAYMAQGFTYFDTAWVYHGGFSERVFGELVAKRYPREKFQVTTKMPLWGKTDPADLQKTFDEQLKKCGVEYFDYYLMHAQDSGNYPHFTKHRAYETALALKKERAVLFFQLRDLAGERLLGKVQFFRGARHVQFIGDGLKVVQPVEMHGSPSVFSRLS